MKFWESLADEFTLEIKGGQGDCRPHDNSVITQPLLLAVASKCTKYLETVRPSTKSRNSGGGGGDTVP